jgi:hypothetical protein
VNYIMKVFRISVDGFLVSLLSAVAIAYVMQKTPHVFPIVGGRKVDHLMANMEALDITLSPDQIKFIESILPFSPGFPHDMIVGLALLVFFLSITELFFYSDRATELLIASW